MSVSMINSLYALQVWKAVVDLVFKLDKIYLSASVFGSPQQELEQKQKVRTKGRKVCKIYNVMFPGLNFIKVSHKFQYILFSDFPEASAMNTISVFCILLILGLGINAGPTRNKHKELKELKELKETERHGKSL